jgi:RIO kinase 1
LLEFLTTFPFTVTMSVAIEDGQFDDAPEIVHSRAWFSYIDSSDESDDLPEDELFDEEEEIDSEEYEDDRVEDEDWEIAERG